MHEVSNKPVPRMGLLLILNLVLFVRVQADVQLPHRKVRRPGLHRDIRHRCHLSRPRSWTWIESTQAIV